MENKISAFIYQHKHAKCRKIGDGLFYSIGEKAVKGDYLIKIGFKRSLGGIGRIIQFNTDIPELDTTKLTLFNQSISQLTDIIVEENIEYLEENIKPDLNFLLKPDLKQVLF